MPIAVCETKAGARFAIRVIPRSSRTAVVGLWGDGEDTALKIALRAPPIEGRANSELVELLSELLGTARSAIEISTGQRGRNKTILVRGHTATHVSAALEKALSAANQKQ